MTDIVRPPIPIVAAAVLLFLLLVPTAGAGETTPGPESAPPACAASMAAWRQALDNDPGNASLHNRLGLCYERLGEHRRARKEFKRAVSVKPSYAEGWNNLGAGEYAAGNLGAAIECYHNAIALRPDFAVAFRNLGAAYLARGEVGKGLSAYREAIRLDPASIDVQADVSVTGRGLSAGEQYFYLAKLSSADGRVDAALDFLAKARTAGFRDFGKVRSDPDFRATVADPRFASVAQ